MAQRPGPSPAGSGAPPAPATPDVNPRAQQLYADGLKAYDEERFRDAVELFKAADQLAPSPRLSFNSARVYERMSDSRSALAAYRDYLRRSPAAENRAEVERRIRELERALAELGVQQLTVLSEPAGAMVIVDDAPRGVTPWTGELAPGQHRVLLTLRGYRDETEQVELPEDHAIDVQVQLQPAPKPPLSSAGPGDAARAPSSAGGVGLGSAATGTHPRPVRAVPLPRWWTWTLFGGATGLLLGAGAFELSRRGAENDARDTDVQIDYHGHYTAMERRQTAARVLLGFGAAVSAAAGVSLYLDLTRRDAAGPEVQVACGVENCRLEAGGVW